MSNRLVGAEVAALPRLAIQDLRTRYAEVFGEGTRSGNRAWLIKRLAWRLQALAEGDLSERARGRDGVGSRCRPAHHGAPSTRDAATDASIQPAGRAKRIAACRHRERSSPACTRARIWKYWSCEMASATREPAIPR